jgi:hypothetical protein
MNIITLLTAKKAICNGAHLENFTIEVQEGILTFKAEKLNFNYVWDSITEPDEIAKYNESEIRYYKRYFLFGEKVPYIPAKTHAQLKEMQPFTLVTNSWSFVCTNKDVNINLITKYMI